jgi:hypothetical protein
MKTEEYTFSVFDDKDSEKFSKSECKCEECLMMHLAQKDWDKFKPKTHLQKRMMKAIKNIENKYT